MQFWKHCVGCCYNLRYSAVGIIFCLWNEAMDVSHAGGRTTRATFIPVEALHTDLELISQSDSSCLLVDLHCKTCCSGGR